MQTATDKLEFECERGPLNERPSQRDLLTEFQRKVRPQLAMPSPLTSCKREKWSVMEVWNLDVENDTNVLIGKETNYLGRGMMMLINAETGVGKSVFAVQDGVFAAVALAFFGQQFVRPLHTLVLQVENDQRDLRDALRGAVQLAAEKLSIPVEEVLQAVAKHVHFERIHISGMQVATELGLILAEYKAAGVAIDQLYLDPLLNFCTMLGDPEKSGEWLNAVEVVIQQFGVLLKLTHHVALRATGQTNGKGGNNYNGFGGVVLPGRVRAVANIYGTDDPNVFKLIYGKRSSRLADGRTEYFMRRGNGRVCWEQCAVQPSSTSESKPKTPRREVAAQAKAAAAQADVEKQLEAMAVLLKGEPFAKKDAIARACKKYAASKSTVYRWFDALVAKRVIVPADNDLWQIVQDFGDPF